MRNFIVIALAALFGLFVLSEQASATGIFQRLRNLRSLSLRQRLDVQEFRQRQVERLRADQLRLRIERLRLDQDYERIILENQGHCDSLRLRVDDILRLDSKHHGDELRLEIRGNGCRDFFRH